MNSASLFSRLSAFCVTLGNTVRTAVNPNRPTLHALREISRTLREAGWHDPPAALTDEQLEDLRTASARFLQPDDLRLIQAVVADRRPLAEVAAELNRSADDVNRQLARALRDLAAFARETTPA